MGRGGLLLGRHGVNEEEKHVLLRDDLAPPFDMDGMQEEMDRLRKLADAHGEWWEHVSWHSGERYLDGGFESEHIEKCPYCQELLGAIDKARKARKHRRKET